MSVPLYQRCFDGITTSHCLIIYYMRQERSWLGPYQLRNNLWSRLYSRFIEARRLDALTPSWPSGLPIPPQSWLRQLPATILRTPKDSRRVSGSLTLRCSISRKAGWLMRKLADFLGTSGLMHHWKEPRECNIQRRTSFGPCSLALDGWRTMLFNDALRWVLGQVVSPNQVSSVIERHPRFSNEGLHILHSIFSHRFLYAAPRFADALEINSALCTFTHWWAKEDTDVVTWWNEIES